jgi:hypothetical protein
MELVKKRDDDDLLSYLNSIDDSNELARTLIEQNLYVDYDPEIVALVRRATIGSGEYSTLLSALTPPTMRSSSRAKRSWRFERIRKHHPALEKLTADWKRSIGEATSAVTDTTGEGLSMQPEGPHKPPHGIVPLVQIPDEILEPSEWDRQLLATLNAQLYARRFDQWPDFIGPHEPPPGYTPSNEHGFNPFIAPPGRPPTMQSSLLTGFDAGKVFDGISFAMWKHGKAMNAHLTIVWSMIRGMDEIKAQKILGLYLNEARKWMAVGSKPRRRLVANPRVGEELHYVWVHENAPGRGFHTHVLMYVPRSVRKEFATWSWSCLARLCKTGLHTKTLRIVPSYAKDQDSEVRRAWSWFRYIMKQLDPATAWRVDDKTAGVSTVPLREKLKPWPARQSIPIPEMKRVGVSHSIGRTAQKSEGFTSKLQQASFDDLYDGREFHDRRSAELFKGLEDKDFEWRSEFKS